MLTFERLRDANLNRVEDINPGSGIRVWTLEQWACALSGEVGELCNLIKKRFRNWPDDVCTDGMLADELADIVIYADLLASRLSINLGNAVTAKFNVVSARSSVASSIRL